MRYVWINKGYISKIASTMTGGFYAFLGLIGTFVSLNEILPDTMPVWIRGIISVAILIGSGAVALLLSQFVWLVKNVLKFFLPIMVTHYIYSMEISLTQMK